MRRASCACTGLLCAALLRQALLEVDTGRPIAEQLLVFNGRALDDSAASMQSCGVGANDLIMLFKRPQRTSAHSQQAQAQVQQQDPMKMDPQTGAPLNPAALRAHLMANAQVMGQLRVEQPQLAELIVAGDLGKMVEYFTRQHSRRREQLRKRVDLERRIAADPFDIEAQKELEEQIRQENVHENMANAMEYTPEVFGNVHMLYVDLEINGHPLKAFVDSGAQMTIMGQHVAEEVGLMRLIDRRFSGIAKGVGTGKILGRVHMAPMKVGGHNMACAITIMESKDMDFLFGLDMLKRHQCSINLKTNRLEFGSVEGLSVPFLGEGDVPAAQRLVDGGDDAQAGGSGQKREREGEPTPEAPPASTAAANAPVLQSGAFPEAKVKALMDLGFPRDKVLQALTAAQGNEETAASLLMDF